jgi:hypothetical protein
MLAPPCDVATTWLGNTSSHGSHPDESRSTQSASTAHSE